MMKTLDAVTKKTKSDPTREAVAAKKWVRPAKEQGLTLDGPNGLLGQFTKTFLETALNEEITKHLGHEKNHAPHERDDTNVRNGTLTKTVISPTTGPVTIQVPRDRDGTFTPVIVPKRHRRLSGVDEVVLSLYARGLTTGEISAHFNQIYGAQVSKETISRITDKVVEEMQTWQSRPLESGQFLGVVANPEQGETNGQICTEQDAGSG
nr:transposase [Cryobacterium levicorallinum]